MRAKNLWLLFILIPLLLTVSLAVVQAQDDNESIFGNLDAAAQPAGFRTGGDASFIIARLIGTIVGALIALSGVVFVSMTVYAGLLWLTSAGAEEQIGKAKKILRSSIIGLLVTLGSWAIYQTILFALRA
ncbi:MAG TPA: hypothetical protein VGA08_03200 [Candidatus Saccharimonadales bacterium]